MMQLSNLSRKTEFLVSCFLIPPDKYLDDTKRFLPNPCPFMVHRSSIILRSVVCVIDDMAKRLPEYATQNRVIYILITVLCLKY